ncbi:MAG: MFS transporter [Rudaea sp.]
MADQADTLDPNTLRRNAAPSLVLGGRVLSLPPTFAALRHYNYRLFFAGQLTSLVGTWMQNVAQAWLVYDLTQSPFYLGFVSFASSIPVLTLSPLAGVVIDRVPKRSILLCTQTIAMLLAFLLSADVFLRQVQPWHIIVLSFCLGIVNTFDGPTRQSFVVEMVERQDLSNAIALNSAIFNTARIIGPTLAGIALAAVGPAWCFFLNGVSFLAVIAGLYLMRVRPMVAARKKASALAQLAEGISYIRHHRTVLTLMSIVAVANLFAFGYSSLLPAFAQDVLGVGPAGLGFMSAAVGVGALSGALLIASLGNFQRKGALLTAGNLIFPAMVLLLSLSRRLELSLVILAGAGFGFLTQNATTNTLIQSTVPDELRGRVMSVYLMIFQGFFPLGSLLAGTIAQSYGVPAGAAFGACVALAYGMLLLWRAPYVRRLA